MFAWIIYISLPVELIMRRVSKNDRVGVFEHKDHIAESFIGFISTVDTITRLLF
jgi:hypothetical protein